MNRKRSRVEVQIKPRSSRRFSSIATIKRLGNAKPCASIGGFTLTIAIPAKPESLLRVIRELGLELSAGDTSLAVRVDRPKPFHNFKRRREFRLQWNDANGTCATFSARVTDVFGRVVTLAILSGISWNFVGRKT